MVPPTSSVVFARSSDPPERPPTLPLGADATMLAPRAPHASHVSQSTRRTAASSMAAEIFGFSRDMSGHMMTMMGQLQAQVEAQRLDAQVREQMLCQTKSESEAANLKREQALLKIKTESDEANRKREQLFMEHELKRQKMFVEANTSL